jgi:hypothetical protein
MILFVIIFDLDISGGTRTNNEFSLHSAFCDCPTSVRVAFSHDRMWPSGRGERASAPRLASRTLVHFIPQE